MTSTSIIGENERTLLEFIRHSISKSDDDCKTPDCSSEEWMQILVLAERHEVLALLENILDLDKLPEEYQLGLQFKNARTVHKGISLQALNSRLTVLLEKEGITAVTLKGSAVARFYPVPEFRKTTDIDLFLFSEEDVQKAGDILCANGFRFSEEWHANHHLVMISEKGETVELHTAWADEFKEKYLNQYLEKIQKESIKHCLPIDYEGARLYVYETAWQGYYLLIHMLQHFVGSGFGLRNLCDWVVLWENCDDEKARKDFFKMACDSGTAEFAKAVTAVCVKYLGLDMEKSPVSVENITENDVTDMLLRDILDAGEFGYSEPERMVGMDGNSFTAYIKEFHHQMHINFPRIGRVILFWPVLWLATLIRFLNNNRKFNRAPISKIMKKAGNRGNLVKQLISKR